MTMTVKNTQYFNFIDSIKNIDVILSYTKCIDIYGKNDRRYVYEMRLELIKKEGEYKRVRNSIANIISTLRTHISKEVKSIDFIGHKGKPFVLEIIEGINLRGYGFFPYLTAVILKDTIDFLDNREGYYIYFPDNELRYVDEFERETGNYLRRNTAYKHLEFNVRYSDVERQNGRLENTDIIQLNLNIPVPTGLTMKN